MSTEEDYVELHPDAEKYPYLAKAGWYGPGLENEADVEVIDYECPAQEPPPYVKGSNASDFAFINFSVRSEEYGVVRVRTWIPIGAHSGSRLGQWLSNMGISVGENTRHNVREVPGTKCSIEVTDPRQGDDGRWFTGRIRDVGSA